MARNDTKNFHLVNSQNNRLSLRDMNQVRPDNFLSKYLERVTSQVKIPKSQIRTIQDADSGLESESMTNLSQSNFQSLPSFAGSRSYSKSQL